jgi:hypothetical protein
LWWRAVVVVHSVVLVLVVVVAVVVGSTKKMFKFISNSESHDEFQQGSTFNINQLDINHQCPPSRRVDDDNQLNGNDYDEATTITDDNGRTGSRDVSASRAPLAGMFSFYSILLY